MSSERRGRDFVERPELECVNCEDDDGVDGCVTVLRAEGRSSIRSACAREEKRR